MSDYSINPPPGDSHEPDEDLHRHIIQATAAVFAANGYARSTTRKLAAAAGITEVTLFRHFGNKEKLFEEVVKSLGGRALAAELEAELSGDVHRDLYHLGRRFMQITLQRGKAMRMMFCEADHFPELAQAMAENPRQFRLMLSNYLSRHIEAGTLRPMNTEAAAQAFWGMFLSYSLALDSLHAGIPGEETSDETAGHFVDIFLNGIILQE